MRTVFGVLLIAVASLAQGPIAVQGQGAQLAVVTSTNAQGQAVAGGAVAFGGHVLPLPPQATYASPPSGILFWRWQNVGEGKYTVWLTLTMTSCPHGRAGWDAVIATSARCRNRARASGLDLPFIFAGCSRTGSASMVVKYAPRSRVQIGPRGALPRGCRSLLGGFWTGPGARGGGIVQQSGGSPVGWLTLERSAARPATYSGAAPHAKSDTQSAHLGNRQSQNEPGAAPIF